MPRKRSFPTYRLHRPSGQAIATLTDANTGRRRDVYLGEHGSAASRMRYTEELAAWEKRGRVIDATPAQARSTTDKPPGTATVTVTAIVVGYWQAEKMAKAKPDGSLTTRLDSVQRTLRMLRSHYGDLPSAEFGPLALQRVREAMIAEGWARSTVNDRIRIVQAAFRWAVSQELVRSEVHTALSCVRPLKRGEGGVREGRKIKPVPQADIAAVLPHVSPQVAALIELQLLTGARGGELFTMRPIDLDTTGKVWLHHPQHHKTEHHGHVRTIYLGPQSQDIIKPYLAKRAVDAYMLDPREAGGKAGARAIHDHYNAASYRRAIGRACVKAGVPDWHPHRLRHNAATSLRREFGIEAARLMLGHRSGSTTLIYAEADHGKAIDIAGKVG